MESKKYIDDLTEIKSLMNKSSRFMSLSGLSGILAGIYALIASFIAYKSVSGLAILIALGEPEEQGLFGFISSLLGDYANPLTNRLFLTLVITLLLAIVTGFFFTARKAKKTGEPLWDNSSKRLLRNFAFPLIAGGLFTLVLFQYGIIGLIAPATLIFYGLALVNASKFTLGDIKYLGVANVVLGLTATQFIGYGLYFWALGFGVFHIIYGARMYFKYDRD